MDLDFQHISFVLRPDDEHVFSPHFSAPETKEKVATKFFASKRIEFTDNFSLPDDLILFANEAFPESAINDPLGDVHVWESWQTGTRTFPYPGKYVPLDIFEQGGKTQSPTAIGVIGECLSGLFATAGIGPWPIVRPIRKWPDFIFYDRSKSKFALLESKAFTDLGGATGNLKDRIDDTLLKEYLLTAGQHLLSDRTVSVWGGFTRILSISPFKAQVTFIESSLEDQSQTGKKSVMLNVMGNLVMQLGLNILLREMDTIKVLEKKFKASADQKNLDNLVESSLKQAILGLPESLSESFSEEEEKAILDNAKESFNKNKKKIIKSISDANFELPNHKGFSNNDYEPIRKVGDTEILGRRMSEKEAHALDSQWEKNWHTTGQPQMDGSSIVIRCGGLYLKKRPL